MTVHGVAVFGVTGRMGQSLVRLLPAVGLALSGATASATSARRGKDAASEGAPSGVLISEDCTAALPGAAVAVDFSRPEFAVAHAQACSAARVPLLVGTTGLDDGARAALDAASRTVAIMIAPNTSTGAAVMAQLVRQAALQLGSEFDVEIAEVHHRMKRDAPSGTALALGSVVADARGTRLADAAVFDRHGSGALRKPGSIGFSVQRAGDIVGEHTVVFAADGERIEIAHRATDRVTFAHGALRAAAWLLGRPPGLYVMEDMLAFPKP